MPFTSRMYLCDGNVDVSKVLQRLLQENVGYQFVQRNGQRIFEPTMSSNLSSPPKGCEIFIGNVPKHIYEKDLIPLFQSVGKLYQFRLMMDFNQRTRGYAFATYFTPQHVKKAIEKFNGFQIIRNVTLGVYKSIDNRRLFVGNIPRSKTKDEVFDVFNSFVVGLVNVIMYSSWQSRELNRGFAFLEFETHSQASLARRQLYPRNLFFWDQSLYVDWAEPVPDVSAEIMARVSVLYVKNLPLDLTTQHVHCLFQNAVGGNFIKKTHKTFTYAFVHCRNRRSAEIVIDKLSGLQLDDQVIDIEWARPREYSNQLRASQAPANCCLSVPLTTRKLVRMMVQSKKNKNNNSERESDGSNISSSD